MAYLSLSQTLSPASTPDGGAPRASMYVWLLGFTSIVSGRGGGRRGEGGEADWVRPKTARVSAKTKKLEVVGRRRWRGRWMGRGQSEGCRWAEALEQRRAGSQPLRGKSREPERKHASGAEGVWG